LRSGEWGICTPSYIHANKQLFVVALARQERDVAAAVGVCPLVHVVARGFSPIDMRDNRPEVPPCESCNSDKSKLEHYATAVVPFGTQYPGSPRALASMVPPRLAKNARLHAPLATGMRSRFVLRDGMIWEQELALPLGGMQLARLFDYITRGLAFCHWGLLFPEDPYLVHTEFLASKGRELFDSLFELRAHRTGVQHLGGVAFTYEGVQSPESQYLTLWRMTLGGAVMGNDEQAPGETVTLAYGLTAPRRMAIKIMLTFSTPDPPMSPYVPKVICHKT
jgi:hypothetical protein